MPVYYPNTSLVCYHYTNLLGNHQFELRVRQGLFYTDIDQNYTFCLRFIDITKWFER